MTVGAKELSARRDEDHLRTQVENSRLRRELGDLAQSYQQVAPEAYAYHSGTVRSFPTRYMVAWEAVTGLVDWINGEISDEAIIEKGEKVRDYARLYFEESQRLSDVGRRNNARRADRHAEL